MQEVVYLPTQNAYDLWAEIYDTNDNPLLVLDDIGLMKLLKPLLNSSDTIKTIADFGCGTGRQTFKLRTLFKNSFIYAFDLSENMLKKAQLRFDNIKEKNFRFQQMDFEKENNNFFFLKNNVDLLVSTLIIEHIKDLNLFVKKLKETLSPNGVAVLTMMHPAVFLRNSQAGFRDPETNQKIRPISFKYSISDIVNSCIKNNFLVEELLEEELDAAAMELENEKMLRWAKYPLWFGIRLRNKP
ncbi:hypothetical protein HK099_008354 [Clydaea vesicula]|uniref:Methyltransferase domain-containing protein n=1 Tax=Clydaea vesicula TaxID=447962 RepID=A0AAD5TVI0_9FUNG|nr:hypothetical protein HK099_008354 [Clydaea vesicula]KAJ3380649.1 hypothetical protein HDU92_005852 [Lobulomyces angularis]